MISPSRGDLLTSEYSKLNPNHKMPVLLLKDTKETSLTQSSSIMRYLCGLKKSSSIYESNPSGDYSRLRNAYIDSWLDWKTDHLRPGAAGLVRRDLMFDLQGKDTKHSLRYDVKEIPREREVRQLLQGLTVLNDHLKTREDKFLVKGGFSLADIGVFCELAQLKWLKLTGKGDWLHDFPEIKKFVEVIQKQKGYKASHAQFENFLNKVSLPSKL
eukprot:snap_masked-scaffold_38-processed-gene-2.57-mRNA-1 protein AED:1.00 eAED:1.00 QI:0/-1/0/0/-1/1/1/0/213